jgi:hypothetical protein
MGLEATALLPTQSGSFRIAAGSSAATSLALRAYPFGLDSASCSASKRSRMAMRLNTALSMNPLKDRRSALAVRRIFSASSSVQRTKRAAFLVRGTEIPRFKDIII